MPTVKFYHMAESPPCRAVEMVAGMIGVKLDKHPLNLFAGDHLKEDYVKLNPLHRVPFIVDDGLKMGESRAIMMYLVNKYKPGSSLYPAEPSKRALVDELLFYEIGTFAAALYKLFRTQLAGKDMEPEDEKAFRECVEYLDKRLASGRAKFLTGDEVTIADISLVVTLDYATVLELDLSDFTNLTAYRDEVKSSVPNFRESSIKPVEALRQFVRSKRT